MSENESVPPVEIPPGSLSEDALSALIESFILREGTDYGESEVPLARKIAQVRAQIARGEVKIYFDAESESVTLLPAR